MSGGSMNYLCWKVEEAQFNLWTPERRAFKKHLMKVAAALKAIEWNDSGDGADDEEALIRECLAKGDVLAVDVEQAEIALRELRDELTRLGHDT